MTSFYHLHRGFAGAVVAAGFVASLSLAAVPVAAASASAAHALPDAGQPAMTPALASRLSQNVNRHVIVIMKSQLPAAHVGSRAFALRSDATAASHAPLMSELREVHATHI